MTKLIDIKSASEWLGVSKDQISAFIEDGDLEYVDLSRAGSSHREVRFTIDMISDFIGRRSRRNTQKNSINQTKVLMRSHIVTTSTGVSVSGSAARFRASIEG